MPERANYTTKRATILKRLWSQYLKIHVLKNEMSSSSFLAYIRSQGYNPRLLLNEDSTTNLIAKLNSSESDIPKLPKNIKKVKQPAADFLSNTIVDMQEKIFEFLDEKSIASLSASSKFFQTETKVLFHWRDRLIDSGCNRDLLDSVIQTNKIKNYKNLYHTFLKIPANFRPLVNKPWELLCLSGEKKAINYAINELHITKETTNQVGENPLFLTTLSGQVEAIKLVQNKLGIDPHLKNSEGESLAHYAALSESIPALRYFIHNQHINKNSVTPDKKTLTHFAALSGSVKMLKYVTIILKLNPHCLTGNGVNVAHYAVESRSIPTVRYAVEILEVNTKKLTKKKENLFHFSIKSGDIEMIEYVMKQFNFSANSKNSKNENMLHLAAKMGYADLMRYAVNVHQINPHSKSINGDNALHWSITSRHLPAARYAIDVLKINPGEETNEGTNILHLSAIGNTPGMVDYVSELNQSHQLGLDPKKPNNQGFDAYWFAEHAFNPSEAKKLLDEKFTLLIEIAPDDESHAPPRV
jgi:ankyrin repeat protein